MAKKNNGDELLNVFAHLQDQTARLTEAEIALAQQLELGKTELEQLEAALDATDELLRQLGVSEEELAATHVEPQPVTVHAPPKVSLPGDIDYHKEYQKLVQEAEAAGFTNVPITALLTEEEMAHAQERGLQLDGGFRRGVQLHPTDLLVISIGIALHLLRIALTKVPAAPTANSPATDIYEANRPPIFDDIAAGQSSAAQIPLQAEVPLSPAPGQSLGATMQLLRALPFKRTLYIKSADQILADTPSFQLTEDARYPHKSDYLGNHSLWGWIVGVFNIITDTITVKDMQTFQPEYDASPSVLHLSQEQLPFRDLFLPFVDNGVYGIQDQLIAGVVREAYVLIPNEISYGDYNSLFLQSKQNVAAVSSTMQNVDSVVSIKNLNSTLMGAGWSNLVNTLLIALHGLFYKKDTDQKQYMVRTMKVVTAANLIGSTLGSLPAVLEQNWLGADFGGFLTGAVNVASLTKLWSDVKAEFLASEHMTVLEQVLSDLDSYFEIA